MFFQTIVILTFLRGDHGKTIETVEPIEFHCKQNNYYFLSDQTTYVIEKDRFHLTMRNLSLGFDDQHRSSYMIDLWDHGQDQQKFVLRSSFDQMLMLGDYNSNDRSWTFRFSSSFKEQIDRSYPSQFTLNIQSSLFMQSIDLIFQNNTSNNEFCQKANSANDVAQCCQLRSDLRLLIEHTNKEMIVTDRAMIIHRFPRCLKFPLTSSVRFWSTMTNGMDIGQMPERFDLIIVQPADRTAQRSFHYSIYPFEQWKSVTTDFNFIDLLLIPHQQQLIFELNICNANQCHISLKIYSYRLTDELKLKENRRDVLVETNVSSSTYFHLYFHLLSNVFYLIGAQSIYTSINNGEDLKVVWFDRTFAENSSRLKPIVNHQTGHIAFVYEFERETNCCSYSAIFTKAGSFHAFPTTRFRSSTSIIEPFFFDSIGNFFFRTTTETTLIIESNQCTLIGTSHLMNNRLSGPFVLDSTDFNKIFHFCSLSVENRSLTLIGSTIQIRSLGSFFIIQQYSASSLPYTFCLQTLHLNDDEIFLTSSRQCQLSLDIPLDDDRLHLTSFDCPWRKAQDEYSTLIVPLWPAIFLEEIYNQSEARGRLFRKIDMTNIPKRVDRWHQFHLQDVEQILDRCSLTDIDAHHDRTALVYIRPTTTFSVANRDQHAIDQIDLITNNDFTLRKNLLRNTYLLTASSFDQRKSLIHQKFMFSQLSCSLPSIRTITFISRCLPKAIIRVRFDHHDDLSSVKIIDAPVNFQLNRNKAGFPSVIVYNLDHSQSNLCDGYKNCSCVRSMISRYPLHCAEHFYVVDSTVTNHVSMRFLMEKYQFYLPTNQSLFFIEELSNRSEYRLLNQYFDQTQRKKILDLFFNQFEQLTDDEIYLFDFLNRTFPIESNFFVGPSLELELFDEGLFHFRLTYLWSDQFCSTSLDILIMLISNTSTISSYTWNYFLACLFVLFCILLLWLTIVIFKETIFSCHRHQHQHQQHHFFSSKSVEENPNFDILVRIREQSQRLLPYRHFISNDSPSHESYPNQSHSSIISNHHLHATPMHRKEKRFLREHLKDLLKEIHSQ